MGWWPAEEKHERFLQKSSFYLRLSSQVFHMVLKCYQYVSYTIKACICIWGIHDCIDQDLFFNELCKSFPGHTKVCQRLLGTRQLSAPSVGFVTGVCESGVTRWQRWYLGEQWAARRVQAICSEYCVTAQRSNAERDANHRAAFISLAEMTCTISSHITPHIPSRAGPFVHVILYLIGISGSMETN